MIYGDKNVNNNIINKIVNSYKRIMYIIYNKEIYSNLLPCCLTKVVTYMFFFVSVYLFFMSGRYFEFGYYGQFGWYIIGGFIAYSIYWVSLKQICWNELHDRNIDYKDCCIKKGTSDKKIID